MTEKLPTKHGTREGMVAKAAKALMVADGFDPSGVTFDTGYVSDAEVALDAVGAVETAIAYKQRRSEAEDALRALTPGGSEFQTVAECVAYIREQYADGHKAKIERVQLRRELVRAVEMRAALEALREAVGRMVDRIALDPANNTAVALWMTLIENADAALSSLPPGERG